jgi:uncharacterized protein YggE
MKKGLFVALGLVLAALTVFAAGCDITSPPSQPSGAGVSNTQSTGIWVTGTGTATAVPDIAILTLGVEVQESTVAQAQSEASAAMNAIFDELKSAGVADKDIQTQQYYITPVWTYNKDTGQQTLVGYRVTNSATAKVRKVVDTGSIIDAVAKAGGNYTTIQGISFTVDNPAPYQETARRAAMADAQAKAKTLADAAKVNLGAPLYINESGGTVPVKTIAVPSATSPAPPPISPGESTITVNVQVVYSIK